WIALGMSLFLVLSTGAADRDELGEFTFVETDSRVVLSGTERGVQGNAQTTNNPHSPFPDISNDLVQIKLLKESRERSLIPDTTPTDHPTAPTGQNKAVLVNLDGDQIVFEDF